MKTIILALSLAVAGVICCFGADPQQPLLRVSSLPESSSTCKACHLAIFQQYNESSHAKAFTNPLFWTLYFKEVVPRAAKDKAFENVARRCVFCHSPVLYMNYSGMIRSPEQAFFVDTGVTCDFCHTFDGYKPNGDYQMNTSGRKHGPFSENSWHSLESPYIRTSDFCASCHNASNHLGTEVRTTFDEWSKSRFAEDRLTCQDCHMSMHGYLKDGKAEFDSGRTAKIKADASRFKTESEVLLSPERQKLYTHFPRKDYPVPGSVMLDAKIGSGRMPDGKMLLHVKVDNKLSGHKMPSGSSDLRMIWLEANATLADGRTFTGKILAGRKANGDGKQYGITGASAEDTKILGSTVPSDTRIYRRIFSDSSGGRALSFVDANGVLFDNRLEAGEVRYENFVLPVPSDFSGMIKVSVSLNYLSAPPSFTQRLGIPDYVKVTMAAIEREFDVPAVAR